MPFDGAPSFEQPRTPVHELSQEQQPVAEAQLAKQRALEVLKQAEQDREGFYRSALEGDRLSPDQKTLLAEFREDERASQLDRVVYTDPSTGTAHTMREYFAASPDVLEGLVGVTSRYREAKFAHGKLAEQAMQAFKDAREFPVNTQEVGYLQMPALSGTERGADGRLKAVSQGIANAWDAHTGAVDAHMQNLEQRLRGSFVMPSIESILAGANRSRQEQQASPQPSFEVAQPTPYAEPVAPVEQPVAAYAPDISAMNVPASPQKPGILARFKKLFG